MSKSCWFIFKTLTMHLLFACNFLDNCGIKMEIVWFLSPRSLFSENRKSMYINNWETNSKVMDIPWEWQMHAHVGHAFSHSINIYCTLFFFFLVNQVPRKCWGIQWRKTFVFGVGEMCYFNGGLRWERQRERGWGGPWEI